MHKNRIVYLNGEYLPEAEAKVSIFDRGFVFADAVYEVTSVVDGNLLDFDGHVARLERSLGELAIRNPLTREALLDIHRELVARNEIAEGLVYLQISRGNPGDRDFLFPAEDVPPTVVLFTQSVPNLVEAPKALTGIKVISIPDLRWARRDIKSVNLLAPVLAKQFALESGAQEAWLTEDGVVTEGASSTAWIVKGKTLISRPLSNKVLPGITRKAVLAYLAESGFTFEEREFTLEEALDAEEAFITSATSLVMPVTTIDGHTIHNGAPGPTALRLREIYIDYARKGGVLG